MPLKYNCSLCYL